MQHHRPSRLPRSNPGSPPPEALADVARRLLAWARVVFPRGTVRDVFAWVRPAREGFGARPAFAFHGPALRLEASLGMREDHLVWNRHHRLDITVCHALGIPQRTPHGPHGSTPSPRFFDDSDLGVYSLLSSLESAIEDAPSLGLDPDTDTVDATVLPEPGYPWEGPGTRFFSAARGRWIEATRPPWETRPLLVRDPGGTEDILRPVADWCMLAPRAEPVHPGHGEIREGGHSRDGLIGWALADRTPVLVTHTFEIGDAQSGAPPWRETAREIVRCGGLLFPSLAVGQIPAANFGPAVLVADPILVLRDLKPYRRRGRGMPATALFSTDAWTSNTRQVVLSLAAWLHDQLTGRTDADSFLGNTHLEILGPELEPQGGPEDARRIVNTRGMLAEVKARHRFWAPGLSLEAFREKAAAVAEAEYADRTLRTLALRYAYLEAKARTIVPMGAFLACYVPRVEARSFRAFLKAAGFKGAVHLVDLDEAETRVYFPGPRRERLPDVEQDWIRYRYAWKIAARVQHDYAPREVWKG
jgi:hypothetical protein